MPSACRVSVTQGGLTTRSEEHTSELQSRLHLVCRLLLEKKKKTMHRPQILSPRLPTLLPPDTISPASLLHLTTRLSLGINLHELCSDSLITPPISISIQH